ncbi:MAG TPA: peptidylprolyl isomerase [Acidovorax temperans]|jgi:peptidyl-prolyl cis-trans isomerase C|nr:peptidylprolyl isomerase [Acidovorax temperans]
MKKSSAVRLLASLLLCATALGGAASHAADGSGVLLQGVGVAITQEDLQAELRALPREMRTQLLADTEKMQQVVDTIYLRKALTAEAERQKLPQQPGVAHQLQQNRENILAQAQLRSLEDAAASRMDLVEAQARTEYRGDKERFNRPAQTLASHILVKGTDAAAKAKAQQLLDELKGGAQFEELARKNSADPGSALHGGSLGWFPAGRMVPEFDAAVAALQQPGELSPLVQSQFGWHIIRLEQRQPAVAQSYEEVRDQLMATIVAKQRSQARDGELNRLRGLARGNPDALNAFIASEKQATEAQAPAAGAATPSR